MAHARTDQIENALADMKEALHLNGMDAIALRFQTRLRESLAARFKQAAPSRFVPTAISHQKYLERVGRRAVVEEQFTGITSQIRRDRPYAIFWKQPTAWEVGAAPPPDPELPPTRWDFLLHRVEDLLVDEADRVRTRELLLENIDSLIEIFSYYCKLGATTVADGVQKFSIQPPLKIEPHLLTSDAKALCEY